MSKKAKLKLVDNQQKILEMLNSANAIRLLDEQAESISGGTAIALPSFIKQSRY